MAWVIVTGRPGELIPAPRCPTIVPWESVSDLVAAAKAKPNGIAYGSEFIGSPGHLGAALQLLAMIRSAVAVEPLVQGLVDESAAVRWAAVEGLRQRADLAVPSLIESLDHYSQGVAGFPVRRQLLDCFSC